MGFTRQQCEAWGIGHLYPTEVKPLPVVAPPVKSAFEPDGMNKLERAFWGRLQDARKADAFQQVWREPIVLRLAGRTTYKPDFMTLYTYNAQHGLNRFTFWETKGFMRDDAAVKLKVAAAQFTCFRWVLVQRDRGKWRCIDVTQRGFAREEWCPDWLS